MSVYIDSAVIKGIASGFEGIRKDADAWVKVIGEVLAVELRPQALRIKRVYDYLKAANKSDEEAAKLAGDPEFGVLFEASQKLKG